MDKSVWEVLEVHEIYNRDSRGKMILNLCASIFSAITKPSHPHHYNHREHTKESLRTIVIMLSEETVGLLADEYEWKKDEGRQAMLIWESFVELKVADLEKIVYQPTARDRRNSSRRRSTMEDYKNGCIFAATFDLEVEAEEYVEEAMTTKVKQLPHP